MMINIIIYQGNDGCILIGDAEFSKNIKNFVDIYLEFLISETLFRLAKTWTLSITDTYFWCYLTMNNTAGKNHDK